MDNISKLILTVIAAALCAIAFRLYFPGASSIGSPTVGDLMSLSEIKDPEQLNARRMAIVRSIPLVRVQGGQVDADVSGRVSIDNQ